MPHMNESLAKLVREAVDLEINAKKFYEYAAEVTANERGKKMFLKLAAEEGGHMEAIGSIIESITGTKGWEEIAEEEMQTMPPSAIVESFKATVAEWVVSKKTADDAVALRMAMELERRAMKYFEDLAEMATDPKAKALAKKLAEEETYHYDLLQLQHDSILNMGIWIDDPEFQMDGRF